MNIIESLKKSKVFENVKDDHIKQIAEGCIVVTYEENEIIFKEGTIDDNSLYIVVDGNVSIVAELQEIDEKTKNEAYLLTLIQQGDTFGEIAILDKGPRTATARAEGKVTLIKLSDSFFSPLAEKNAEIGYRVLRNIASIVCHRLREMNFAVKHRVFGG